MVMMMAGREMALAVAAVAGVVAAPAVAAVAVLGAGIGGAGSRDEDGGCEKELLHHALPRVLRSAEPAAILQQRADRPAR